MKGGIDYQGEIDLLLTDVIMPQTLGTEAAEQIRHTRPDIRVLYMSGYAQPVLASPGRLDPNVTLLDKPFTERELLGEVDDVLMSAYGFRTESGTPNVQRFRGEASGVLRRRPGPATHADCSRWVIGGRGTEPGTRQCTRS